MSKRSLEELYQLLNVFNQNMQHLRDITSDQQRELLDSETHSQAQKEILKQQDLLLKVGTLIETIIQELGPPPGATKH